MSRPISGKKLAKLGRRLAAPGPISDDDYAMLGHVAEIYQAVLDKVEERLQRLGYQATTRVKTTGTLVDKLRRPPQLPLGSIHDVAGARIVMDGGRREQDQIVERIVAAFSDCPKPPLKIDRRERPNHGYRAVHVIVFEDSTPVEIQIRTKMQDTWAQITEKLGDIWGRGLRYGEEPDQPDALVEARSSQPVDPASPPPTRREFVIALGGLADAIDKLEQAEQLMTVGFDRLEREPRLRVADKQKADELREQFAEAKRGTQTFIDNVLRGVRALGGAR